MYGLQIRRHKVCIPPRHLKRAVPEHFLQIREYFIPDFRQLEGPRLVSDGVSAAGEGFESGSQEVTACERVP